MFFFFILFLMTLIPFFIFTLTVWRSRQRWQMSQLIMVWKYCMCTTRFLMRSVLFLTKQVLPQHPVKVVTTLHGTDITLVGRTRSYFPLTQLAINKSDGVTAVSQYLKKKTEETFGQGPKIKVIPKQYRFGKISICFVLKLFRGLSQIFLKTKKIITHVSNFRPVKRIEDVVRIFDGVQKVVSFTFGFGW